MSTRIRFLFMELRTPAGLKSLKCHTDKHKHGKIIHKCTIYFQLVHLQVTGSTIPT